MLRNELEYRNAKKQLEGLRSEVEKRSLAEERETPHTTHAVVEALKMKIGDIESELADYENLKNDRVSDFEADSLDEFGEVVTKARIAKGWSQADLAEALGTHQQQIQRYERNDWQKINLWRLQEVVEVLRLNLHIYAHLDKQGAERPGALWTGVASDLRTYKVEYSDSTVSTKDEGTLDPRAATKVGVRESSTPTLAVG
jgi:ribosome-binding protein aMBF1 (putative translation factor)